MSPNGPEFATKVIVIGIVQESALGSKPENEGTASGEGKRGPIERMSRPQQNACRGRQSKPTKVHIIREGVNATCNTNKCILRTAPSKCPLV